MMTKKWTIYVILLLCQILHLYGADKKPEIITEMPRVLKNVHLMPLMTLKDAFKLASTCKAVYTQMIEVEENLIRICGIVIPKYVLPHVIFSSQNCST